MTGIRSILFLLFLLSQLYSFAQQPGFELRLEEVSIKSMPKLQSFAYGVHDGNWIFVGGRTDGLHKRQPFASFDPKGRPDKIWVVDPEKKKSWSQSLKDYPAELREQLQSSNMVFHQQGQTLILIGGYGYSETSGEFVTHPILSWVNVPAAMKAIQEGRSAAGLFHSYPHAFFQVTGGQMLELGDWLYIAGGQHFEGRYNPMGPDHMQGFFQQYTNEIRAFRLENSGGKTDVRFGEVWHDSLLLHRRDFNAVPQVLVDGRRGAVLFSGVFQYEENIPWLNSVLFDGRDYKEIPGFEQLLSHYQCSRLPVFDASTNHMHTFFLGGMARYVPVEGGLRDDINVPFVKTVSRVTRNPKGDWAEFDTGLRMPGFLGATAELIPSDCGAWEDGILMLDKLPMGETWVGTVVGGLDSKQENTFFEAEDDLSRATKRAVRVYVTRQ